MISKPKFQLISKKKKVEAGFGRQYSRIRLLSKLLFNFAKYQQRYRD